MSLVVAAQKVAPTPFPGVDNGQAIIYVFFTLVAAGNYLPGGDVIDWTSLGDLIKSGYVPINVTIQSQSAAAGHSGYQYYFRPGAALNNCKMQVLTTGNGAGNALQELAAGAYPAAILADTIVGMACFVRV